jgi:hypothetical protein
MPVPGPDGKPQPLGPAMVLLVGEQRIQDPEADGPNPMRSFRIEIAADTLVELDEQTEKQDRMELLVAFGTAIEKGAQVGAIAPPLIPLIVEVLKFCVQSFKVGKAIEGSFDTALDQLKQMAAQQPMGVPPEVQKQMEEQQAQLQQGAQDLQKKDQELQQKEKDLFERETKHQVDQIQHQADKQVFSEQQKTVQEKQKIDGERQGMEAERDTFKVQRERDALENSRKDAEREGKEVEAKKTDSAEIEARNERMEKMVVAVVESNKELGDNIAKLAKVMAAPKKIKRDPATGRADSVEVSA